MSQEATAKRADPPKRRLMTIDVGQVRNGRPDRKYMLANPNDDIHGLQMKLDQGWQKVNGGKDGDRERINGGRVEPSGLVTFQGQVLIWIDRAEFDGLQAEKLSLIEARHAKSRGKGGIDGLPNLQDWKGAE